MTVIFQRWVNFYLRKVQLVTSQFCLNVYFAFVYKLQKAHPCDCLQMHRRKQCTFTNHVIGKLPKELSVDQKMSSEQKKISRAEIVLKKLQNRNSKSCLDFCKSPALINSNHADAKISKPCTCGS